MMVGDQFRDLDSYGYKQCTEDIFVGLSWIGRLLSERPHIFFELDKNKYYFNILENVAVFSLLSIAFGQSWYSTKADPRNFFYFLWSQNLLL